MNQPNRKYPIQGDYPASHLTKREHFAALALDGLIASRYDSDPNCCARKAVEMADALLQALAVGGEE